MIETFKPKSLAAMQGFFIAYQLIRKIEGHMTVM